MRGPIAETTSEVQQKVYHDAYDQANDSCSDVGYNALSSFEQQNLHDAVGARTSSPAVTSTRTKDYNVPTSTT